MTNSEKDESYYAVQSFLNHLGYKNSIPRYLEKVNCKVSITGVQNNGFYNDSIEIEHDQLWVYFLIFYPYLHQFGLGNKINSKEHLFEWDDVAKILRVEVDSTVIRFTQL